ncbi:hypothetical protein MPSEU_000583000 [Mayamaea pseudoterrestris]|nr:hypothetical protein MPSEU_000583000 [Mayamaea pseudoterrestris]
MHALCLPHHCVVSKTLLINLIEIIKLKSSNDSISDVIFALRSRLEQENEQATFMFYILHIHQSCVTARNAVRRGTYGENLCRQFASDRMEQRVLSTASCYNCRRTIDSRQSFFLADIACRARAPTKKCYWCHLDKKDTTSLRPGLTGSEIASAAYPFSLNILERARLAAEEGAVAAIDRLYGSMAGTKQAYLYVYAAYKRSIGHI